MATVNYNFNVVQGCSFVAYFYVQNTDGTPMNLSGYSPYGYVKSDYSDSGVLLSLNPIIQNPVSGIVAISGSNQNSLLPVGTFQYDVEVYSGLLNTQVAWGDFNIYPSTAFYNGTGITYYTFNNPLGFLQSGTQIDLGVI